MSNFRQAANYTDPRNPLPHQNAAWDYAWGCLTEAERAEFLSIFRAAVPSKKETVPNTWDGVYKYAKSAGARYPEVVAAQWALESNFGKKVTGAYNYFGLKGAKEGTSVLSTEYIDGKKVEVASLFVNFNSLRECIDYLIERWYKDWSGHKGVNNAVSREECAYFLVREKYATDPKYAEKLIKIMNERVAASTKTEILKSNASVWNTKIKALKLSQPDAVTCQAACIGMAIGDSNIRRIRSELVSAAKASGSSAGDPAVMSKVIRSYGVNYVYDGNASLFQVNDWLKAGELLITHGWFTNSGHVIVLDGLRQNSSTSYDYNVADPWSEFDGPSWSYNKKSVKFYDGYYNESIIYAACVAGASRSSAASIYKSKSAIHRSKGGMWVHRFLP